MTLVTSFRLSASKLARSHFQTPFSPDHPTINMADPDSPHARDRMLDLQMSAHNSPEMEEDALLVSMDKLEQSLADHISVTEGEKKRAAAFALAVNYTPPPAPDYDAAKETDKKKSAQKGTKPKHLKKKAKGRSEKKKSPPPHHLPELPKYTTTASATVTSSRKSITTTATTTRRGRPHSVVTIPKQTKRSAQDVDMSASFQPLTSDSDCVPPSQAVRSPSVSTIVDSSTMEPEVSLHPDEDFDFESSLQRELLVDKEMEKAKKMPGYADRYKDMNIRQIVKRAREENAANPGTPLKKKTRSSREQSQIDYITAAMNQAEKFETPPPPPNLQVTRNKRRKRSPLNVPQKATN